MSQILNIGLIGAGRIGQVHARTIANRVSEARLLAVTDPIASVAHGIADKFRISHIADDYRRILDNPEIDAVMICTPTDTHADIIVEAAQRGKHIFCEKPIALTLGETDRALLAVKNANVKLQVGFNRRFDPNFARVRQAIASGEIGDLRMLHIISRDPSPPPLAYVRVSGGIFLDMTIHDWDMARFLTGSEITEVYVNGDVKVDRAIGDAGDIDTHITLLKFANGVIGSIDNCRQAAYGYDQRAEAFGSKGMIQTQNNYPNNSVISTGESVRRDLPLNFFMQRYTESYALELESFVSAVLNDMPVAVSGDDGRTALAIGLAAKRSYEEGRPVKL
jgi:myo-inositol 2-dehydrogenase/D-chiro-inositol 1-dehydrogenase